jgi:hypothetical protein
MPKPALRLDAGDLRQLLERGSFTCVGHQLEFLKPVSRCS